MKSLACIAVLLVIPHGVTTANAQQGPPLSAGIGRTTMVTAEPSKAGLDVYEAVFRYRIRQHGWNGPFFLQINGADPSDEFLARFKHFKWAVRKRSAAYIDSGFPVLRDRVTGAAGYELYVSSVIWTSNTKAEVVGGMYCSGICADDGTYYLSKTQNGKWIVIRYKIKGVS